jgi:hypothetical protein
MSNIVTNQERERLVEGIILRTKRDLDIELYKATRASAIGPRYDLLLMVYSVFSPTTIAKIAGSENAFFKQVTPTAVLYSKQAFVLESLGQLQRVCASNNIKPIELPVETYSASPVYSTGAFRGREGLLARIQKQGREEGVRVLLTVLEGEVPLIRYRRDAAERIGLRELSGGAVICDLGTKVPQVDVRLAYASGKRFPTASLIVNPLRT